MAYELSFGPEFFFAEGEPYDGGGEPSERPVSVWQAIESMRVLAADDWAHLAREHYGVEPQHLIAETVLDTIQATNTCSNLNAPVRVWIDPAGNWSLKVY